MKIESSTLSSDIRSNLKELKQIFYYLFPQNKIEVLLFLVLFIFYLSYSLLFLFNTLVVDNPYQEFDIIFSFDNCVMFHQGAPGIETHPLLKIFMHPLMLLAVVIGKFWGFKAMGVVMVSAFSSLIAMGVVYVHRYLRSIAGLSQYPLWLLTFMYAFFFTNLILCFIVESYSISICLLAFSALCFSLYIRENVKMKLASLFAFTFILGGVTVTNGLKAVFPYLFTPGVCKRKIKTSLLMGIVFLFGMVLVLWLYYGGEALLWFVKFRLNYTDWEMNMSAAKFYENLIDLFLGSPIFSSSAIQTLFNEGRFSVIGMTINDYARPVIIQDFYRHFWQYLWVVIFYSCILYSVLKNYKNQFIHLLLSFWLVDFFVHLIVGYGFGEAFIFGGHWVYLMPMILAWGYKGLSEVKQYVYTIVLSLLAISMAVNNIIELRETYLIAVEFFPSVIPDF